MRFILLLVTLIFASPILAEQSLSLENEIFNMTEKQWANLDESIAINELTNSFVDEKCIDADVKTLHERYAVSFDGEGQLCRVYDLTFPHLKLLLKGKRSVTSIPAQKFKRADFVNWVDGNYEQVYQRVAQFQQEDVNLRHKQVATWIKRLRFKKNTAAFARRNTRSVEMPQSFYASDINFGKKLRFSKLRKNQLKRILSQLAKADSGVTNLEQWDEIINNPQSLLKKIRFDWNNVKKVYEIALEGQFLPINGPIALVNFDRPHKVFVEGILRRVVQIAVGQVIKRLKGPTGLVIGFAVNEAFVSIDKAYGYQMNRLEASFKDTLARGSLVMSSQDAKRGLNHVYLGQVDLVSEAILRMVQGQKFPWDQLEAMGRKQHFQTEKLRDVMMDSSNNYLVKKKGCSTEQAFSYFSLCKLEENDKLFTLISQFNIYGYNFGPTQTFDYEKPNRVLLRRSTSYMLSIGLSIARTPVPKWITSNLSRFLRQFAFTGVSEEAYLLSELSLKKLRADILPPEKPLLNMLYLQNLNLFTPKSIKHENKIIAANKELLGLN